MPVQAYASAVVLVLAAAVVGRALCVFCGGPQRWAAAPLVGLGTLIILARVGVKLPGQGVPAEIACLVAVAVAAFYLVRRRLLRVAPGQIAIAGLSLLIASVPFIASGRVGIPAGLDNDMAVHLLVTEGLRSSRMAHLWGVVNGTLLPPYKGYPLGGNSLVATLGNLTGMRLDLVFTGLLMAIAVLTAVVAAELLANRSWWRRAVIGLACAFAYLVAAYYAQAAFKETLMAAFLLAFVLHLEQVQARWNAATNLSRWRLTIPGVILVAAGLYTYSYLALTWFGATLALWAVAAVILRPARFREWLSRRHLAAEAPWVGGTIGVALLLMLPEAGQAISFFSNYGLSPTQVVTKNNLGNLAHALSPFQSFGIWFSPDFRQFPSNVFHAGELAIFALAVVVFGFVWSIRSRRMVLAASAAACALIWWYSNRTQSPYVAAKALVIASPIFIGSGLAALLGLEARRMSHRLAGVAVAVVFCGLAGYSTLLALRNEPIQAPEAGRELASFARTIGDARVLFLGVDDFAPWQLREAAVTTLTPPTLTQGGASTRPNKPYVGGGPLDFDSVNPTDLDNFSYVVTASSAYASTAPPNFRLLASDRFYDLWGRTGHTPARWVFEPPGSPGAILDCKSSKLRSAHGQAAVMTQPLVLPGLTVPPGSSRLVSFGVPRGSWELSIQYFSNYTLHLRVDGQRWTMPAYVGRTGPFFRVGTFTGRGVADHVNLVIELSRPSVLTGSNLVADITGIAAVRLPSTRHLVPLHRACGHYVDWFTLS